MANNDDVEHLSGKYYYSDGFSFNNN